MAATKECPPHCPDRTDHCPTLDKQMVIISPHRGLSGSINSNVLAEAQRLNPDAVIKTPRALPADCPRVRVTPQP